MNNTLQIQEFKKRLKRHLNFDIEVVINENRSTMLNVLDKKRDYAKVSVHSMFLKAPEEVISAIATYVKGARREKREENLRIRSYIQTNLERLNYSSSLDRSKMVEEGEVYHLREIYDELNEKYFSNALDLMITWYGVHGRKNRSRVTFGQYFDHLRLVKIHRILDDPFFPPFFVSFVVYHEMLHHIVSGFVDGNGLFRTHGSEFKQREKLFEEYDRAIAWEKKHRDDFFCVRGKKYGRA